MVNNEKNETATIVNALSDEDTRYALYLNSKLQRSQNDIKNGRVMTIEESKERMRKKYADFDIK